MLEENTLVSVVLLTEDAKDEDVFNTFQKYYRTNPQKYRYNYFHF